MQKKVWVSEIFDSYQGEGIYFGVRQIFLRFCGCNLRCGYCDTPQSLKRQKYCKIIFQKSDCRLQIVKLKNPVSVNDIIRILKDYLTLNSPVCAKASAGRQLSTNNVFYHSISLTGGEPLLQADFLSDLTPQLKKLGLKVYLDTNGTLPSELKKVISKVDYVAMDIKLPSATGKIFWEESKESLRISKKKAFVKIVIDKNTKRQEIVKAIGLARGINRHIPVILQPSGSNKDSLIYNIKKAVNLKRLCGRQGPNLKIMPQIHKIMGFI